MRSATPLGIICGLVFSLIQAQALSQPIGADDPAVLSALREPGAIVLIRHAQTVSGIGDPAHFRLDDCSTQRNLSQEGLTQSARFGRWLVSRGLRPNRVRSSQWCRCLDTATAAFSGAIEVEPWSALNSFFQGHGNRDAQLAAAKAEVARNRGGLEVWVTHQVVISSLTGSSVAMGEFLVVKADTSGQLQVLGRGLVD